MHVDHPEPRNGEDGVGENLAVGGDDAEVGVERGQRGEEVRVLQRRRLEDREAGFAGADLDGRIASSGGRGRAADRAA